MFSTGLRTSDERSAVPIKPIVIDRWTPKACKLGNMRVAIATWWAQPAGAVDDQKTGELLDADFCAWDDQGVDWKAYDRVIMRSVRDYLWRPEEFQAWCDEIGSARLRNTPELVSFTIDKERYMADLSVPVVPTTFVRPGGQVPVITGEVVVKPSVSAGARDTGRFGIGKHTGAYALIARLNEDGRTAMVQPYFAMVEKCGETAFVFLGGELSHVLTKRAILCDEGVAPVTKDELQVAKALKEDGVVVPGVGDDAQHALARMIHDKISTQFGVPVFLRVDLVPDPDGEPVLLELEAIEPSLYLASSSGASQRLAAAIRNS